MSEEVITLNIELKTDYRQGIRINISDEPTNETMEIDFRLPKNNDYRLYLVNEFRNYQVIYSVNCDTREDYLDISNKIFSQLYNTLSYVKTGYTISYKDQGYYPDVSDKIKNLPNIKEVELIKRDLHGYYFVIVLDSEGDVIYTLPIQPIY